MTGSSLRRITYYGHAQAASTAPRDSESGSDVIYVCFSVSQRRFVHVQLCLDCLQSLDPSVRQSSIRRLLQWSNLESGRLSLSLSLSLSYTHTRTRGLGDRVRVGMEGDGVTCLGFISAVSVRARWCVFVSCLTSCLLARLAGWLVGWRKVA